MKIIDESKIPPLLKSRTFKLAILKIRYVTLYLCVLCGIFTLGFVAWYFFIADPSQLADPTDGRLAPLGRKLLVFAFVLGWNVVVVWTLLGDRRKFKRLASKDTAP